MTICSPPKTLASGPWYAVGALRVSRCAINESSEDLTEQVRQGIIEVAFEVTTADFMMVRLVRQGLGIAMLPSTCVPRLTGLATIEITDAPTRVEYLIWGGTGRTPAATAFLNMLELAAG